MNVPKIEDFDLSKLPTRGGMPKMRPTPAGMKRLTVLLPPVVLMEIQRMAVGEKISVADWVARCIEDAVLKASP